MSELSEQSLEAALTAIAESGVDMGKPRYLIMHPDTPQRVIDLCNTKPFDEMSPEERAYLRREAQKAIKRRFKT